MAITFKGKTEKEEQDARRKAEEFIKAREKLKNEKDISRVQASRELTSGRKEQGQLEEEQGLRRQEFQEATDSDVLAEELQKKIEDKPSLEPESIGSRVGSPLLSGLARTDANLPNTLNKFAIGEGSAQDVSDLASAWSDKAKVAAVVGTLVAAPEAIPSVATMKVAAVMGGKLALLKTALAGVLVFAGGGAVLDWRGKQMAVQREIIGGYVEDGEKLIAMQSAGLPPQTVQRLLQQASDEIDEAERVLMEAGRNNYENIYNKEWEDDMNNIRTARIAVLRRTIESENIAATGSAQLNPQQLLFLGSQFE